MVQVMQEDVHTMRIINERMQVGAWGALLPNICCCPWRFFLPPLMPVHPVGQTYQYNFLHVARFILHPHAVLNYTSGIPVSTCPGR